MKKYKPFETGEKVIEAVQSREGWFSVKDVGNALNVRRNTIRYTLDRLVEDNILEKRLCDVPITVYPHDWEDWGDYARRQWRKRNKVNPHRFPKKNEYKLNKQGVE